MNILYLDHQESDYGSAYLFDGLNEVLGGGSIYTNPRKWSYYGKVHNYSTAYIPNGMTAPLAWSRAYEGPLMNLSDDEYDREVERLLGEGFFNLVIVASMRENSVRRFKELYERIRRCGVPVVVHDGEDFQGTNTFQQEFFALAQTRILLKREIPTGEALQMQNVGKVLPFPFSCPIRAVEGRIERSMPPPIEFDATFMLGRTHNARQEVFNELHKATDLHMYLSLQPDEDRNGRTEVHLPWDDYIRLMNRSACAVSVRGFGVDTCRYWEIPAVTVMVADRVNLTLNNPFENGKNALFYDTPQGCVDLIKALKNNPNLRSDLYQAGVEHLKKYHTTEARARYLLENL